jgi:hypothetical protein
VWSGRVLVTVEVGEQWYRLDDDASGVPRV